MKTKYALLTGLAVLTTIGATYAQVEHDDMYFNSKDRAKLNASKQEVLAKQYKQQDLQAGKTSPINPTDSYSGRSVNPEYTNRLKTNPNLSDSDQEYFNSNYQPINVNQNLASNTCNCASNNYFNNSNYGYGGYGMNSHYGMNSGFGRFNSFNSPWGMGNGFYQPGWSSMMGFGFGGMNSGGFGSIGYGYGNSWGSPWNSGYGSSFYNSYYGMPYGYGGYGSNYYGNTVIVNNGGDYRNPVVYGKRSNRSSDTDHMVNQSRPETESSRTGRVVSNGRTRSDNETQYYDRGWKRDPEKNPSRSYWSDNTSTNSSNDGSRWSNTSSSTGRQNSSSSWGESNSRSSMNSGGSSFGGSSRSSSSSSGGSSGGSGGGSRSRGRD